MVSARGRRGGPNRDATAKRGPCTPSMLARPTAIGIERRDSPTVRSSSSSSAPPPASTSAVGGVVERPQARAMLAATVSCLIARRRLRHSSAASLLENGTRPALPRVHSRPIASAGAGLSRNSRAAVLLVRDVRALDPQSWCPLDPLGERARDAKHPCDGGGDRLPRTGGRHRRSAPTRSMVPPPMSHTTVSGGSPGVVRAPTAAASGSVAIVRVGRPVRSCSVSAASAT